MSYRLLISALAIGLLAPAAARADKLREPSSEHEFEREPALNGVSYRCQAAGIRKKAFIKVYALAFCLEKDKADATLATAKAAAGGKVEEGSQAFFDSLRDAKVAKAIDMYFVRNVGKDKIAEAYQETLSKALGSDDAEGQAKFLALVDRDVKEGEHIVLTTQPDGTIHLSIGGQDKTLSDPKVAAHIWNAWLGKDGVSPTFKEALAQSVK
jgi:hypothetical protein